MKVVRRYGRALTADLLEIPGGALVLAGDYDDLAAKMAARIARLEAALHEVMPRYCEMFEALGLGDSSESIAVKIARAALEQPHCATHKRFEYDCLDCVDAAPQKGVESTNAP